MAGSLLSGDRQFSRRRWVSVAAVFMMIVLLITATSHYRPLLLHDTQLDSNHSRPSAVSGSSKTEVSITELVKPKDVQIVGMIFFGRRSRVELLRCYIEVRLSTPVLLSAKANSCSAI